MANEGIQISNDQRQIVEKIAHDYIKSSKGWDRSEYTLNIQRQEEHADSLVIVIEVAHADDLAATDRRGGGKSVQLYVDVRQGKVVKELAFQ